MNPRQRGLHCFRTRPRLPRALATMACDLFTTGRRLAGRPPLTLLHRRPCPTSIQVRSPCVIPCQKRPRETKSKHCKICKSDIQAARREAEAEGNLEWVPRSPEKGWRGTHRLLAHVRVQLQELPQTCSAMPLCPETPKPLN